VQETLAGRDAPPSEDWLWAKKIEESKLLLASGYVAEASLDYDLGEGDGLEGYNQLLWMAEHDA
jgi:hypothetical protein